MVGVRMQAVVWESSVLVVMVRVAIERVTGACHNVVAATVGTTR
jgi:hypothetical protein